MDEKLQKQYNEIKKRLSELEGALSFRSSVSDSQKTIEASKEYFKLQKTAEIFRELEKTDKLINENKEIISESGDEELKNIARQELSILEEKRKNIEKKLFEEKSDSSNIKSVVVEIRAGAGGDEAAIFAADLFRMYSRYAKLKNWEEVLIDSNPISIGGYKEIVFEIKGKGAYKNLRWESGVHRVQRVPETEKSGRVHTSTASVAVLPQVEAKEVEIRPQDLELGYFHSGGPGGQNVNKVETGVRITHIPTGFVVASQSERSQARNREKALEILRSKIFQAQKEKEEKKIGELRKGQVGTADRSEKIRTYNFPQDRITDHRVNLSWHNIEKVMAGEMEELVKDLAEKLAK